MGQNLLLDIHNGSPDAFDRLVIGYQDRLFSFAWRLLRDTFDAQEVVQDVFVRVHRTLTSRYNAEQCRYLPVDPWLFRITRNLAFNRLRERRSRPEQCGSAGNDDRARTRLSTPIAAAGKVGALERMALEDALGRLGAESRSLVVLRFVEGLAYAEIAAATEMSEASARGKIFRALRKLRAALADWEA